MNSDNPQPPKHIILISIGAILVVILVLIFFSWVLTRGVDEPNDNVPTSEQQVENAPLADPANPNIDNGSSGADNSTLVPPND